MQVTLNVTEGHARQTAFKEDSGLPGKTNSQPAPHPDQKYIDALLTNNGEVLNELYQRFSGKIKWMILQNNGTEADIADVFQDALLSIYHRAKTKGFILTCPFDAYFYMVCKNLWLSQLHKRKTQKLLLTDTTQYENIDDKSNKLADECLMQQARRDLLTEKLDTIGQSNKEFLQLCWSGVSMEEVARIFKISYGYARKKKSECVAKLVLQVKKSPYFKLLKG